MVLNATFNNIAVISWRPVLLVEETGVPKEKLYREGFELTTLVVIDPECISSCNSNYHAITTTTALVTTLSISILHNN
jgi:hypothetical protein